AGLDTRVEQSLNLAKRVALSTVDATSASAIGSQCGSIAGGLQRVPRALASAYRSAQNLYRDANLDLAAGDIRCDRCRLFNRQRSRQTLIATGGRHQGSGGRQPLATSYHCQFG